MPTNKPEVVLPEFKRADSLAQRCADILLWRKTGSLPDDSALRAFASQQQFDKHEPHRLQGAEYATLQEAAEHIADTLTRPADGEFVMVPAGWVIERTAANEVRVTCEGDVSVMAREGGAYSGSLAEYALYGLVSDMLSAAPQQVGQEEFANCCDTPAYCSSVRRCTRLDEAKPQQPAEAVMWQARRRNRFSDEWGAWIDVSESTKDSILQESTPDEWEFRALYTAPPPAIDIGKLRELYNAAGKGFHISETCGQDGKYWYVSKFPDMASLHAFVDAWTAVMRDMRDAK